MSEYIDWEALTPEEKKKTVSETEKHSRPIP